MICCETGEKLGHGREMLMSGEVSFLSVIMEGRRVSLSESLGDRVLVTCEVSFCNHSHSFKKSKCEVIFEREVTFKEGVDQLVSQHLTSTTSRA